jgi:integrase
VSGALGPPDEPDGHKLVAYVVAVCQQVRGDPGHCRSGSPARGRGRRARGADDPELDEEFIAHFDRLRRAGRRTNPDAYAFPNTRGGRTARERVAQIVGQAAARASEQLTGRGLPPLPHTTPHTLRRTYISIAAAGQPLRGSLG